MPPSGFNQKAIDGLLEFVKAEYETIADQYSQTNLLEKEFLEKISNKLEKQVSEGLAKRFPDSEKMNRGIQGLITFVVECFRDLSKEIIAGKDKYQRPVIDGNAIQKEIDQLREYLCKFRI